LDHPIKEIVTKELIKPSAKGLGNEYSDTLLVETQIGNLHKKPEKCTHPLAPLVPFLEIYPNERIRISAKSY
jgi:hypothetical protein